MPAAVSASHLLCLTVITNIIFNHHEVSRNEAIGIGLSSLSDSVKKYRQKYRKRIADISEKVSISVSTILLSENINIDIGDNFWMYREQHWLFQWVFFTTLLYILYTVCLFAYIMKKVY